MHAWLTERAPDEYFTPAELLQLFRRHVVSHLRVVLCVDQSGQWHALNDCCGHKKYALVYCAVANTSRPVARSNCLPYSTADQWRVLIRLL